MKAFLAYMATFGWVLLGFAVLEAVLAYLRGNRRDLRETLANFVIFLVGRGLRTTVVRTIQLGALIYVSTWIPWKIPTNFWTFPLLLLFIDFTYYAKHYTEHYTRFFWTMHCVHHSSHEFNLSTALRLPWLEGVFDWMFFLPAIIMGFDPLATLACFVIVLDYQFWVHSESIPKLGWVEKVFNTASHHRVHHGSNPQYIDKNLGGILIIWDKLFGTFEPEEEPVRYGLTTQIGTSNPLRINFDEPTKLVEDMVNAESLQEAVAVCCHSPAYQPKKRWAATPGP